MIPTARLAWLLAAPAGLAVAWVVLPGLLPAMLALDGLVVVVALVDALRAEARVGVARAFAPLQSVGRAFPVTLTVRNEGGRPLDLLVDDDQAGVCPALPAALRLRPGEAAAVEVARTIHRRGLHEAGPVTVRWRSPWGLWARQRRIQPPGDPGVRVYPDFGFLRREALRGREDDRPLPVRARRRPGGESEFLRLRPYLPGDPYRHVDWKATARRRQLVTREYGQEVAQNVILVLEAGRAMTMRHGEGVAFDHALAAALALAHGALRHGDRVGLLVFDREIRAWIPPRGGRGTATRLVQATYDVFPRLEEPDHALAFRHLSAQVRRRSLVVLFTAATDRVNAEAAGEVVRALAGRHLPVVVWMEDPRFRARALAPAADPGEAYARCAAAAVVGWRAEALAAWRRRGALVVDAPPEALTAELLSSYLEVKARRLL